jgi:hypothetical protein
MPVYMVNLYFNDSLVFKVNPELLNYHVRNPDILPEKLFIWSGEWDKDLVPIEEHVKFVMIKELFVEKKRYKDTQFYSYAVSEMKKGYPLKRGNIMLDSMENINLYFEKHKKLFKDIDANGFDLNLASNTGVVVDRNGNLIHFRGGHHTLAMAKILGVKRVNIKIRAVHSEWLLKQLKGNRLCFLSAIQKGLKKLSV